MDTVNIKAPLSKAPLWVHEVIKKQTILPADAAPHQDMQRDEPNTGSVSSPTYPLTWALFLQCTKHTAVCSTLQKWRFTGKKARGEKIHLARIDVF